MSIESLLERIAVALEGKATPAQPAADPVPVKTATKTTKPKPAPAPEPEPEVEEDAFATEPAKTYTAEDVRAALVAYSGKLAGTEASAEEKSAAQKTALALLAKHGNKADRIPALKPEFYGAVVEAANAAAAKL